MSVFITQSCVIEAGKVFLNGQLIQSSEETDLSAFAKIIYKSLEIEYPKFYKMDEMSKLAFVACETLLKDTSLKNYPTERVGMLFTNASSSLQTDVRHQADIQNSETFFPSPAVFVYTLANICMGEVAIRNGIKGENCFFVSPTFDARFLTKNSSILFKMNKVDAMLGAWVEVFGSSYKVFTFLLEKEGEVELSALNLDKIYTA